MRRTGNGRVLRECDQTIEPGPEKQARSLVRSFVAHSDGSDVLLRKRPHVFDPVTCSQCSAQKVRCTGERNGGGCRRCQSMGRKCYPPRRSNTAPGEKASGFTDAELIRPDPLVPPTPAPTEDPARPVSSATTNRWINESRGDYNSNNTTTGFSNFPLDPPIRAICNLLRPDGQLRSPERVFRTRTDVRYYDYGALALPQPATANLLGRRRASRELVLATQTQVQGRGVETDCQCLRRVVIRMDGLELLGEPTTTPHHLPVSGILVAHRRTLRQAQEMPTCAPCAARVGTMMSLAFLVSRLTDPCCRAMVALLSWSPPTLGAGSEEVTLATVVGAYRLESEMEYVAVARVLLRLGLDRLPQGVGGRLDSETMGGLLDDDDVGRIYVGI
ncbi:hypothetical protein F4818DRAFT_454620 [Hypoxylon cercidicola]|nr:hypothetical protein F4818DRAFT_454620 [Hypoxylon cercidicola]